MPSTSTACDTTPFSLMPFYHAQNAPLVEAPTSRFGGRTITGDRRGNALGGLRLSQQANIPPNRSTTDGWIHLIQGAEVR